MRFSLNHSSAWSTAFNIAQRWVHPSVAIKSAEFKRHSQFLVIGAIATLAAFTLAPIAIAFNSAVVQQFSSAFAFALFFCLPGLLAIYVARTGNLAGARKASLIGIGALICVAALSTGGLASPCIIMLMALPIEAGLWKPVQNARFGLIIAGLTLAATALSAPLFSAAPVIQSSYLPAFMAIIGLAYGAIAAARMGRETKEREREVAVLTSNLVVLEAKSDVLVSHHDLKGDTLDISASARKIIGCSGTDLMGKGLVQCIHLQDRIAFLKALSDASHSTKSVVCRVRVNASEVVNNSMAASGSTNWRWLEVELSGDAHENGIPSVKSGSILAVSRDITQQCDQERALEEASATAVRSASAQNRFLATMSHELRTPLNAIVGFSEILNQGLFGKLEYERHHEYVSLIHKSGHHLLRVVNDLLDMSRIEAGRYELSIEQFEIGEVIGATTAMLEPLAHKAGVNLVERLPDETPMISADRHACQQIMINLVSNAIKFSPDGGPVQVSASVEGRNMKICVKDSGIGIDPAFMPDLGKPFTQADNGNNRKFEGSGLGLCVVKGLVDLHDGTLHIDSKPERGTTMTVRLPLRSSASRPVPSSIDEGLVSLSAPSKLKPRLKPKTKTNEPVSVPEETGEHCARVSA